MWAKHPDIAKRWEKETQDAGEESPLQRMAKKYAEKYKDHQPGRDDKPTTKPKDARDPKQPGPSKPA